MATEHVPDHRASSGKNGSGQMSISDLTPPVPPPTKSRLNIYVHGARGLFAAFVFAFHVVNSGLATYAICMNPIVNAMLRSMEYGVELFFIISGFVITESLKAHVSPRAFLRNRAIRIFPVLWATIAVLIVLEPLFHKDLANLQGSSAFWVVPANLLALPGVLPLPLIHPAAWSLSYEFTFYLVCTLAICMIGLLGRTWTTIITALISGTFILFYPRAVFFLVGALIARSSRLPEALNRFVKAPGLWLIAFLACWEIIQRLSPKHIQVYTLIDWAADFRLPLAAVAVVAATMFFLGLAQGRGLFSRFLSLAPLQWLGTVSYSLYLWHPIVMAAVKHIMLSSGVAGLAGPSAQLLFFVFALPPTLLVAALSQRLLEVNARLWIGSITNNHRHLERLVHPVRALPSMHE